MSQKAGPAALHQVIELIYSLTLQELLPLQLVLNQQISQLQQLGSLRNEDERRDESRAQVKAFVQSRVETLKGPQLALCACYYLTLSGAESFPSRLVGSQIEEWTKSRPSNITSLMDTLRDRGQVAAEGEDGPGIHKSYRLSESGKADASRLLQKLEILDKAG